MAAPRWLVRALLYPVHERLRKRPTVRYFRTLRRNDRLSAKDLQAEHDRLLVAQLRRAAETVPFYREQVDAAKITEPGDIARFPLLDKPAIREAGDRLKAEGWTGGLISLETGGSSGEPLRFFSDPEREASQLACKLRARAWWGLHPGHRETDLWGSPIETGRQGLARRVTSSVLGYQLLSAFDLNDATMAAFGERLRRGRADFVYGYPSVLGRYARWLEARGEHLRDAGLQLAICTAEMLLPHDREDIARVLGCPVANEYGCRDGGLIAHEAPSGALHLMHDAVHVEVIDEASQVVSPGEEGEVVLTNLHAYGFPLIRYRLGDRIVLSPDPSPDSPHPLVASLQGRVTDSLVKTDGSRVHGLALIYILRELPGVARFRCHQKTRDRVDVVVVAGEGFDPASITEGIIARAHRVLGDTMKVHVDLVSDLPPLASGKHRFIICDVP